MNRKLVWALCSTLLAANYLPAQAASLPVSAPDTQYQINQTSTDAVSGQTNRQTLHEQAIALARSEQFADSLAILRHLYETDRADLTAAYDYITVLNWSGNNALAIELYESLPVAEPPDYVLRSIGGAYYQTGQYQKAAAIFEYCAAKGDNQAKLWQAECLMYLGDITTSHKLYNELISQKPDDPAVYLSRATLSVRLQDYKQAVADFDTALTLLPATTETDEMITIDDALTAALINSGDLNRAITILKPYIDNHTANISMQGNYILALRANGQYQQAINEAAHLWPDYGSAPLFGLRALAESHVQLRQIPQAIAIYNHILSRQPNDDSAQFGLAFCLLLENKLSQGLAMYDELLKSHPDYAAIAANDAGFLLENQHYIAGKALFDLIVKHRPDSSSLREQYAAALRDSGQPRLAFRQYQALARLPEGEVSGLAGWTKMALELGDYRQAQLAVNELKARQPHNPTTASLIELYDTRQLGESQTRFSLNTSYKQLQSFDWEIAGQHNLSSNYWLLTGINRVRLDDHGAQSHAVYYGQSAGIGYNDMNKTIRLRYTHLNGANDTYSYSLATDYHLTDKATLSLDVSRSPIMDVQALAAGPIMAQTYRLNYFRILSSREDYSITVSRSLFSDNNHAAGYSLNHTYTIYDKHTRALNRLTYWNRTYFKEQDLVYESPSLRESLGTGWIYKQNPDNGSYLQGRLMLNWEHDVPDPLSFSPYIRLEYGKHMSSDHSFILDLEYGLRSDDAAGSGLRYSYRQIDGLYRFTW